MRAQLGFKACERFVLQLCGLAARGGAAGAARQTSNARRQANCVVSAVCSINRTAFVGCQLQPENQWEQYGGSRRSHTFSQHALYIG